MRAQARIAGSMQAHAAAISDEAVQLQAMLTDARKFHSPGGGSGGSGPHPVSHIDEARELGRQLHLRAECQEREMAVRHDERVREAIAN